MTIKKKYNKKAIVSKKDSIEKGYKFALIDSNGKLLHSSISDTREDLWQKIKDEAICGLDNNVMYDTELLEDLISGELKIVQIELNYNIKDC